VRILPIEPRSVYRAVVDLREARTPQSGSGGAFWVFSWIAKEIAARYDTKLLVSSNFDKEAFGNIPGVDYLVETPGNTLLRWKPDFYFSLTNGNLDTLPIPHECLIFGIILDVQHKDAPQFLPSHIRNQREVDFRRTAAQSDVIITISEAQRNAISRLYPTANVRCLRLHTNISEQSNAIGSLEKVVNGIIPVKPFLFYPALNWGHKNHFRLYEAFDFVKSRRATPLQLVLSGGYQRDTDFSLIEERRRASPFANDIVQLGFVDEITKVELYRNCQLVPFVSLYEGFGLPLIEAQRLGAPVIAARNAVSVEVLGEGGHFFSDAQDSCAIADDIVAVLEAPPSRGILEEGRQNSLSYTPEESRRSLFQVIEDAALESRRLASPVVDFVRMDAASHHLRVVLVGGETYGFDAVAQEIARFRASIDQKVEFTVVWPQDRAIEWKAGVLQSGLQGINVYYGAPKLWGCATSAAIRYGGYASHVLVARLNLLKLVSPNRLRLIVDFLAVHHVNHLLVLTSEAQVPNAVTLEDNRSMEEFYLEFFQANVDLPERFGYFFRSDLNDLPAFRPLEAQFAASFIGKIRAGFVSLPHVPEIE